MEDTHHRIQIVMDALREAQFPSPIEFAQFHLYHLPPDQRSNFFEYGAFTSFVDNCMCYEEVDLRMLAQDKALVDAVYPIVGRAVENEASILVDLTKKRRVAEYTPDDIADFSFQHLARIHMENAPVLTKFLHNFILLDQDLSAEEYVKPPPTSTSANTKADLGGHSNKKILMMTMAVSILLYARNRRVNYVQAMVGYFLAATNTGKRTIDTLNGIGVAVSYESILKIQTGIADASMIACHTAARK